MQTYSRKITLVVLLFACLFAAGPASAGYLGFSAKSLETEDSGGC